jgi:hypothetical protein
MADLFRPTGNNNERSRKIPIRAEAAVGLTSLWGDAVVYVWLFSGGGECPHRSGLADVGILAVDRQAIRSGIRRRTGRPVSRGRRTQPAWWGSPIV